MPWNILTFQEFVEKLNKHGSDQKAEQEIDRALELTGMKEADPFKEKYAVQITIEQPKKLLLEHEYKQFKKTTNRYMYHPENPSIPLKPHYHVYPSNSKKELYAVNVEDGKAHHKGNRGHTVPKKEADELRTLGVKIPDNNLLESRQFPIQEGNSDDSLITFIIIEEE